MKKPSQRFEPSRWFERLVPVLLVILLLGLVVTLAILALALLGAIPGA